MGLTAQGRLGRRGSEFGFDLGNEED